ncbi:MAG TPA: serine hydrolase domain-containing protein [Candidatus Cybelea sp.]
MPRFIVLLLCGSLLGALPPTASPDTALRASLQNDLDRYLAARAKAEHISALSLSVSLHGVPQTIDVTAGTTRYGGGGAPITPETLWQIGSNTKAFTSVLLLQLEAERKLNIRQTIGRFLPQYPAWKNVTIARLLHMTSGIPGYDSSEKMLRDYASSPNRHFTTSELVRYAYPTTPGAPAATTGYSYSNTNYILAEMIVEKVTRHSYTDELNRRILRAGLGLDSTYYQPYAYPPSITERMTAGYFFSHDADNAGLAPLLGRDMRDLSVSWMQGAGGIVSRPIDVTRWARALYTGSILAPKQRAELMSLVSQKTGRPIRKTTLQDPGAFGLGVAQITKPGIGTVWFYEGMTLGYRMLHLYFPRQDAVIAFGINSQPDSKQNQSGQLAAAIYKTLHAAGKL